jgi:predicted ABC-type ATPase
MAEEETVRERWARWEAGRGGEGRERKSIEAFAKREKGAKPESKGPRKPRKWTEEKPKSLGEHKDTFDQHFKDGKPTPERQREVHDPIVKKALDVEPAKPDEQKVAILTMGGTASGKSSMLSGVDTSRFVKVDPDAVKEALPEWKGMTDPENTFRGAALAAHEESSFVAKKIRDEAISNGNHVLIDGTGASSGNMSANIDRLKAEGYQVHVMFMHVEVETGIARARDRAEGSGRYVPDHIVKDVYEKVPSSFIANYEKADDFQVFDNSGAAPRRVWSKSGGESDAAWISKFKSDFGKAKGMK